LASTARRGRRQDQRIDPLDHFASLPDLIFDAQSRIHDLDLGPVLGAPATEDFDDDLIPDVKTVIR
jgi:hypothetical protein